MKLLVVTLQILALIGSNLAAATRIAGGSAAAVGQYPFMASMQMNYEDSWWQYLCGGTLLTRVLILSDTEYYSELTPWLWRARLGSNMATSGGTVYTVSQIVKHPELSGYNNDLSIVRLATPAVYSDVIQPARIAGPNYILPDGTMVHAAGFGTTTGSSEDSDILLRVDMPIVNQQVCADQWDLPGQPNITERMICTGGRNMSTCVGDNGGPVVHGSDVIVGVISFSYSCGLDDLPSVHSRVSVYASWIASFQ